MGGAWRMPTKAEMRELLSGCYWQWTTDYDGHGTAGFIVYKAKDNADKGKIKYPTGHFLDKDVMLAASYSLDDPHLFLPAAGRKDAQTTRNVNRDLINWTSSLSENDNQYSVALYFASSDLNMLGWSRALSFTHHL